MWGASDKLSAYSTSVELVCLVCLTHPAARGWGGAVSTNRHQPIVRSIDQNRLRNILLKNIAAERGGEVVDRSLLHNTLTMLVRLGVKSRQMYEIDFERPFLEATANFYRLESQECV